MTQPPLAKLEATPRTSFQLTWALGEGSGEPAPPILSHPHCWSSVCSGIYGSLCSGRTDSTRDLGQPRNDKERQGTLFKPTEEPRLTISNGLQAGGTSEHLRAADIISSQVQRWREPRHSLEPSPSPSGRVFFTLKS